MKLPLLTSTLLLFVCSTVQSQTTLPAPETRTFELTVTAPPSPAMKYQLLFDDGVDRRPGNAALLYHDTVLLLGPDAAEKADKALAAFDAGDMAGFNTQADALDRPMMFQELDLAGRREECNWDIPFREMGARTLLPHLAPLRNGVAKLVKIHALRQMEQGKVNEALATLRLGYELSDKVGTERVLIAGMVSLSMTSMMNDALARLMSRPDAPNLYWALCDFPERRPLIRYEFEGARLGSAMFTLPNLSRVQAGEEVSAEQWRSMLHELSDLMVTSEGPQVKHPDPITGATPQVLALARAHYAQTHQLDESRVIQIDGKAVNSPANQIDPAIVLGAYYFDKFVISYDEMYKLLRLPYPALISRSQEYGVQVDKWISEQPANPFLNGLPAIGKAVWTFARTDRQLAALTAVEAIRSYAAANGGALPARLQDITATPVPLNPATGKAFEYKLENSAAVLSDTQSQQGLTYTIRIRPSPSK